MRKFYVWYSNPQSLMIVEVIDLRAESGIVIGVNSYDINLLSKYLHLFLYPNLLSVSVRRISLWGSFGLEFRV